jgi:hypothetical protein
MTLFAARFGNAGYYPPIVGALTDSYANPNGSSSWDFNMAIGSAAADRYVVVAATWTSNSSRPFVARLAGSPMTLLSGGRYGPAGNTQYAYSAIWALALATGTIANVEVDLSATSGSNNGFAMWVYRLTGINIANTVVGEDSGNQSPRTASVALRQGDFVVASCVANHTPSDNIVISSSQVSLTRAPRQGEDDTRHASYYGNALVTGTGSIRGEAPGTITGGVYVAAAAFRA